MAAPIKITEQRILAKISDLYRIGLSCSIIPSLFAALLVIDSYTTRIIELFSFILLLCIILPLSLIGLSSTLTGLKLAARIENGPKKTTGTYTLLLGSILLIGQLAASVFVFLKSSKQKIKPPKI